MTEEIYNQPHPAKLPKTLERYRQEALAERKATLHPREARERWHSAREAVEKLQIRVDYLMPRGQDRYHELPDLQAQLANAKERVQDAKTALEESLRLRGHEEAQEHVAKRQAEREKRQDEEQRIHAQEAELEARVVAEKRFLAAGGTPDMFAQAWPGMWMQEVIRRSKEPTAQEQQIRARYGSRF